MNRSILINCERVKMREPHPEDSSLIQGIVIIPKRYMSATPNLGYCQCTIFVSSFENISPPKRPTGLSFVWYLAMIVSIPDQLHPRYIILAIELVKMFHKQSLILHTDIENPKTTFILRHADQIPS